MKKVRLLILTSLALTTLSTSLGFISVAENFLGIETAEAAAANYSFARHFYGYPPSYLTGYYGGYPYRVYLQKAVHQGGNDYYGYYSGYYYY